MVKSPLFNTMTALLLTCVSSASSAELSNIVSISANAHICNSEAEVARLAVNPQLREMARALVEFKPTKLCFIMPDAADVVLIEQQQGYIKFDYKSQVLYTFSHYVVGSALTASNN